MSRAGALSDELAGRFPADGAGGLAVAKLKREIKRELQKLAEGGGGSTSIRPARRSPRRILEPGEVTRICLEMEAANQAREVTGPGRGAPAFPPTQGACSVRPGRERTNR